MEKKINKIQNGILMGFTALYIGVLLVNAAMAILGLEELAVFHYPILLILLLVDWASLTNVQRARFIITIEHIMKASIAVTKKTATTLLCFSRAVRCLPALFIKTVREFKDGAVGMNLQE